MNAPEVASHIIKEIERNLQVIKNAKSEHYDEFAKEKIKVLVDVLDLLDEASDETAFVEQVRILFRGKQGALDGLNDLLQAMGQK